MEIVLVPEYEVHLVAACQSDFMTHGSAPGNPSAWVPQFAFRFIGSQLGMNEKVGLEKMLEQYKHFSMDVTYNKREKILRSMAWQQSVKAGTYLSQAEVKNLVEDLFACEICNTTPTGKTRFS